MPKNRIKYNVEDLYVGPAEINSPELFQGINVLQPIERVQGVEYSFDISKTKILELGRQGSIDSRTLGTPSVNFNFSCIQQDISNESRVGINTNWRITGGSPQRENNFSIHPFINFVNLNRETDRRNFYLVINNTGETDILKTGILTGIDLNEIVNEDSINYNVICFINSYMNSYRSSAKVGGFLESFYGYTADSISFLSSGSGMSVPIVDSTNRMIEESNVKFIIPKKFQNIKSPSALTPGDVIIDLSKNIISNISTGIMATASSLNPSVSPSSAIDGDTRGTAPASFFSTLSREEAVWELDLGEPTTINSINFWHYWSGQYAQEMSNFRVSIFDENYTGLAVSVTDASGDPSNLWGENYFTQEQGGGWPNTSPTGEYPNGFPITPPSPIVGQHIRIELISGSLGGTKHMLFSEVEVSGSSSSLESSTSASLNNVGLKFSDVKIDSYDLNISLNREDIQFLGTKIPVDRIINFPIIANLNLSMTVGEHEAGDFLSLLNERSRYDLSVKVKDPREIVKNTYGEGIALQYDFKNAELVNLDYSSSIQGHKRANLNFECEVNPDNLNTGFFISGTVSATNTAGSIYLSTEDGFELITEDSDNLITEIEGGSFIYGPTTF